MGASAVVFFPLDGLSAHATGLSTASIDPGLPSIVAIHPLQVAEIAEGGSASANARSQNFDQGCFQSFELPMVQASRSREGMNPSLEQTFIGVDVSNARDQ